MTSQELRELRSLYPVSRLPGMAVLLFLEEEEDLQRDPDATRRGLVAGQTVDMRPAVLKILVDECREKSR